jgi:hypothetical protein
MSLRRSLGETLKVWQTFRVFPQPQDLTGLRDL